MSSEKFEDSEEEFRSIYEALVNTLKNRLPKLYGEQRKEELRNMEKQSEDISALLNVMMEEGQSAPGAYRTGMISKVRGYRYQLDKLKKDIAKATAMSVGGRDDLLEEPPNPATLQRNRMVEGLDRLAKGSDSIERSHRIAAETDEVGVQIISSLEDQRESLLRSRDKVKQTHADLGRSRRILNSMAIKLATNKVILVVIIFLELCILGAVIYLKFIKK